jgi:hypothetical protein
MQIVSKILFFFEALSFLETADFITKWAIKAA